MSLHEKCRTICIVVIKISVGVRRKELRNRLEYLAFQLTEDIAAQNYENAARSLTAMEKLISLGGEIYEIEPMNTNLLLEEIEEIMNILLLKYKINFSPNIEEIIDKKRFNLRQELEGGNKTKSGNTAITNAASNINNGDKEREKRKKERKTAIREQIRQNGNIGTSLRDILTIFPDVSERTLRYDLQELCEAGGIERIGAGGPGTRYKEKKIAKNYRPEESLTEYRMKGNE